MNFRQEVGLFQILICVFSLATFAEDFRSTSFVRIKKNLPELGLFKEDVEYYRTSVSKNSNLIYSEEFKNYSAVFSDYIRQINLKLSKVFLYSPHFIKNFVFLPSSRIQYSNASATVYPFPIVALYPTNDLRFLDHFSIFYWYQDTLIHEMTHIYQILQNSIWEHRLSFLLGPVAYRKMYMSIFAIEGSAVLNESIYGFGGRLFSGWVRAFVFSQIKKGFSFKRLFKDYNDPFSSSEKYFHGGYFFAYLHSQYGEKKVNQLFSNSVWIGFPGFNLALKKTFGKNFKTLFEGYKQHYFVLAQQQKTSTEPAFLKSKMDLPMNSDDNTIYFLISDMKSPAQLIRFDKKTEKIKKKAVQLPLGKVFYKNGTYYSSSNGRTSNTTVEYSLFGEGYKPLQKYNSQLVMDFHNDQHIFLDTKDSHLQNSLFLDDVFYDTVHSSAIMDHKGRVYYFKQKGSVRTLYRNKKPLVSFSSYYAYPVEGDATGLYFISATKSGSSLFVYKEGVGVFRLSKSDTISNARKISENKFLVAEIRPTHLEYKIISTQKIKEKPFLYGYSFKKQNFFKTLKVSLKEDTTSVNFRPDIVSNKGTYNSLSHLELQRMFFVLFLDLYQVGFLFSDPLQFNQLLFLGGAGSVNRHIEIGYKYQKYRPKVSFLMSYDEGRLGILDFYRIQTYKDISFLETEDIYISLQKGLLQQRPYISYRQRALKLALTYSLLKRSYWNLSSSQSLLWGQKQFRNQKFYFGTSFPFLFYKSKPWKSYFENTGSLTYSYKRKYAYSYSFYSKRIFELSYSMLSIGPIFRPDNLHLSTQAQMFWTEEVGNEWFVTVNGTVKTKMWDKNPKELFLSTNNLGWSYGSFRMAFQNLYQLNFQILKALNHSFYPATSFFSLKRWAPFIGVSFLSIKPANKQHKVFLNPFIGAEWDVSLLLEEDFFKIRLTGGYIVNMLEPQSPSFQMRLKTNLTF